MSIYIGNNLEDRLEALEAENASLRKYNEYHQVVHEINFENGSHFICSFNLNNPESTVCIAFRLNSIASGNNLLLNGIIGNSIKYVAFYKTHSGLGLLISTAYHGSYIAVANDKNSFIGVKL